IGVGIRWVWRKFARWRLQHARRTDPPELLFYTRFCRQLENWGMRRTAGQTPAEFAEDVAARYPLCRQAPDLVQAYYDVAFGGKTLSSERLAKLQEFLAELTQTPHYVPA